MRGISKSWQPDSGFYIPSFPPGISSYYLKSLLNQLTNRAGNKYFSSSLEYLHVPTSHESSLGISITNRLLVGICYRLQMWIRWCNTILGRILKSVFCKLKILGFIRKDSFLYPDSLNRISFISYYQTIALTSMILSFVQINFLLRQGRFGVVSKM